MGLFSKVFKIAKKVAPLALPFLAGPVGGALGIGSLAAGAGLGAAGGALSGGGLKNVLLGAAGGGLANSGFGDAISKSLFGAEAAGPPTAAGVAAKGSTSGVFGNFGKAIGGGGASSLINPASTILSGIQSTNTQDDMEKKLLAAQGKSAAALDPYLKSGQEANAALNERLNAGFNPGDLSSDPGYQFTLNEGTKALDRSNAAKGNYFSGAALKGAADYTTGLANNTWNDRYNQWLQQNSQIAGQAGAGQSAANSAAQIYDNQGNIQANAELGKSNIFNNTLSNVLNGSGAIGNVSNKGSVGSRRVVGTRSDGTPIYEDELVGA